MVNLVRENQTWITTENGRKKKLILKTIFFLWSMDFLTGPLEVEVQRPIKEEKKIGGKKKLKRKQNERKDDQDLITHGGFDEINDQ